MRRRLGPLAIAALLGACGSNDTDTTNGSSNTDSATSEQLADIDSGQLDTDEAPLGLGTNGGGTATLTLDDIDYGFDIEFCVRSPFGMSGFARSPNDEKLSFSYETSGPDDDDRELVNSIEFEPADRNADWRAGSVTGDLPSNWGSLLFTLRENTIEGTGAFENTYDPGSLPVDGSFTITCE